MALGFGNRGWNHRGPHGDVWRKHNQPKGDNNRPSELRIGSTGRKLDDKELATIAAEMGLVVSDQRSKPESDVSKDRRAAAWAAAMQTQATLKQSPSPRLKSARRFGRAKRLVTRKQQR
jgi:hypothetical protein